MPETIRNQASLTYLSDADQRTVVSNIAAVTLQGPLTALKQSVETTHRTEKEIVFMLSVTNGSAADLTGVTVADDRGTYEYQPDPETAALTLTPLDYVGPSLLYVDGVYKNTLTPTVTDNGLSYDVGALRAGETAMIVHKMKVNGKAPLETGGVTTNTMTAAAGGVAEAAEDDYTLTAEEYADVTVMKTMSPDPVLDGETLTYNFALYNMGNLPATGVVLTDRFTPAPTAPLTVAVDGRTLTAAEFTYENGTLTVPPAGAASTLTVPAAEFVRDAAGAVTVNPGMMTITVSGAI